MGYACPVCETAQADAAHLANHLAFTAMLGDDEHEAWLDERVPDWADRNPETLGPAVAEYAPERDPTGTTDDPAARGHDHDRERGRDPGRDAAPGRAGAEDRFESELARQSGYGRAGTADEELARVLEEARDLTERMAGNEPLGADGAEDQSEADEGGDETESEGGTAPEGESEAETE